MKRKLIFATCALALASDLSGCGQYRETTKRLDEIQKEQRELERLEALGRYEEADKKRAQVAKARAARGQGAQPDDTAVWADKRYAQADKFPKMGRLQYEASNVAPATFLLEPSVVVLDFSMFMDDAGNPSASVAPTLGSHSLATADASRAMAVAYLGQLTEAEQLIIDGMSAWKNGSYSDESEKLHVLAAYLDAKGVLAQVRGDYAGAEAQFTEAMRVREQASKGVLTAVAPSMWRLAALYQKSGQWNKLEQQMQRAADIFKRAGAPQRWNAPYAQALNNLGAAKEYRGELQAATVLYDEAVSVLMAPTPGTLQASFVVRLKRDIVANQALVSWKLGAFEQAFRHAEAAYATLAEWDAYSSGARLTEQQNLRRYAGYSLEHDAVASLQRSTTQTSDLPYQFLLRAKGGLQRSGIEDQVALHQLLASPPAYFRKEDASLDQELVGEINKIESTLAAMNLRAMWGQQEAGDQAQIAELQRRLAIVRVNLATRAAMQQSTQMHLQIQREQKSSASWLKAMWGKSDLSSAMKDATELQRRLTERLVQTHRVAAQDVVKALPSDAALLDYVVYRPYDPRAEPERRWGTLRYGVYVVRKSQAIRFVDLGDAAAIDKSVSALREQLSNPRSRNIDKLAHDLDDQVVQPVRAQIGETKQVFVAPDGQLNLLPFGALRESGGRYLAEQYALIYISSGRDLIRAPNPEPVKGHVVVLAGPDFGAVARALNTDRIELLPGTLEEAKAIAGSFPKTQIHTGPQASETLLKNTHRPRILHVATHGFFVEDSHIEEEDKEAQRRGRDVVAIGGVDNPLLRSGLILTGSGPEAAGKDDGVLTALEASGLDLLGTQLVVLSACETGVGQVKNGQGVFGLRQAFTVAGAETLVMSLWKVDDTATQRLMANYYSRLSQGEGRVEALRQAQLEMIRDKRRGHPFYWAAFIASGRWEPLQK